MGFYMALHAANLFLQNPPCALERIVDCKINVRMAIVGVRFVSDVDLFLLRQSEADVDLEKATGPVMGPRTFQHDTTSGNPAGKFLKLLHMALDRCPQCRLRFHSLEVDVHLGFHL